MAVHRGFITMGQKFILDFLQFPDGEILQARIDDCGHLELCISDAEMPEVREGDRTPPIKLTFTKYQDVLGHWVDIRDPLKKE